MSKVLVATVLLAAPSARSQPQTPTAHDLPPLPSAEQIVQGLLERARLDAVDRKRLDQDYAYTSVLVRDERNPKGNLRSRKEERETHEPARSKTTASGRADEGGKDRAYEEEDIKITRELLARFRFTARERESIEGHEIVRVDFEPISDHLPAPKLLDRFINRMTGTLWLEESSWAMVRAELHLLDKVSFIGGIAGAVYRLECTLDRAVTPEGVWYTRSSHWHADFREFLVHKIVDVKERREDLRHHLHP